jgi:hypothetical protein
VISPRVCTVYHLVLISIVWPLHADRGCCNDSLRRESVGRIWGGALKKPAGF